MKEKRKNNIEVLDLDSAEDNGFIEGDFDFGKALVSFSFTDDSQKKDNLLEKTVGSGSMYFDQRNITSDQGITPAVDGEYFTVKRSYQLRPSTIRKLNELKAKHPDINIYFNTLVDQAINFYYKHSFSED